MKRWLRSEYAELRMRGRRGEIEAELSAVMGRVVSFERCGQRGQDSMYRVLCAGEKVGVLRLVNPFKRTKVTDPQAPFIPAKAAARLQREWDAYGVGGEAGLTPRRIWRTRDATLSAYVPWQSMHERLLRSEKEFWPLLWRATRGLAMLHQLGLTHMDASLANVLADGHLRNVVFVDFEFAPAPNVTRAQQKAYDFLRLLESSLKFLPPELADGYGEWVGLVEQCADEATRAADIGRLWPALPRLKGHARLRGAIGEVFSG